MSTGYDVSEGGSCAKTVLLGLLGVVAVFAAFLGIALAMRGGTGWLTGRLKISIAVVLFAYLAFLSATIARLFTRNRTPAVYAVTNLAILLSVLTVFAFWILRGVLGAAWYLAISGVVVIAHVGSFVGSLVRRHTITRLVGGNDERVLQGYEKQFHGNSFTYVAAPLGSVIGVVIGAVLDYSPARIVTCAVLTISALILVFLAYFIADTAAALLASYCVADAQLRSEAPIVHLRMERIGVRFPAIPAGTSPERVEQVVCDSAVLAADIRKLYLYNQYQQLGVALFAGAAMLYLVAGGRTRIGWALLGFVVLVIASAQVPYMIGQQRERNKLLFPVRGARHAELRNRLNELAPLYPKPQAYLALTASGTFGAIAVKLLEKGFDAVQPALKAQP